MCVRGGGEGGLEGSPYLALQGGVDLNSILVIWIR